MTNPSYILKQITCVLCLVLVWSVSPPAHGGLIVTIPDANLVAGGTGTLDIQITGTAPDNQVKAYGFSFLLTPNLGATTLVQFVNPQAESQLLDGNYIFAGDSDAITNGDTVAAVATTSLPSDTLNGEDLTDSLSTVTVDGSGRLLATLDLLHFAAGDPETAVGQTFTLSLNSAQFLDGSNSLISFSSNTGTLTITSATAAVPEPSSLAILLLLSTGAIVKLRKAVAVGQAPA